MPADHGCGQVEDEQLSVEEAKERKIMKMLLKVKNGTPPQRKSALRQLTDKARDFGAGPLFNQILPLLMSPTLEDQERHLLVKVRPGSAMQAQPLQWSGGLQWDTLVICWRSLLRTQKRWQAASVLCTAPMLHSCICPATMSCL